MQRKYFALGATFNSQWYWGRVQTHLDDATLAKQGMREYTGTVEIEIVDGKRPGDFLWCGMPIVVASHRLLEIFGSFQKFGTYPVSITNKKLDVKYTGIAFCGRGGPFDAARSHPVYTKTSDRRSKGAIMSMDGLYFDEQQWDGSDLLTVNEFPCIAIVTERVKKEMVKAKITNCRFIPLEEWGKIKVPDFTS